MFRLKEYQQWCLEELADIRRFLSTQHNTPKVIVLNAWNEWTEGSVLLPTKDAGWAVLKALKAALSAK